MVIKEAIFCVYESSLQEATSQNWKLRKMHLLLAGLFVVTFPTYAIKSDKPFVELEDDVFQGSKDLRIAAFTDLNADKSTDLLYISKTGKSKLCTSNEFVNYSL